MKKTDIASLGTLPIKKLFFKMALPAVVSQLIVLLNNFLDRMYVGHIADCGGESLAAIGVATPIVLIPMAVSSLVSGGAPAMSIYLGKNEIDKANHLVGSSLSFLLFVTTVLAVIIGIFAHELLTLSGASDITTQYAEGYLRIMAWGIVPTNLIVGLCNFIGGQGQTQRIMKIMAIAVFSNMILDPLMIFGLDMGVRGAALATVTSVMLPAFLIVRQLTCSENSISLRLCHLMPDWRLIGRCCAMGLSPFVAIGCESCSGILYNSSLLKYGGDIAVSAMSLFYIMMQIYIYTCQGLSVGMQPIISYSYGQGNMDRVKNCARLLTRYSFLATLVLWIVIMLSPYAVASIFTEDEALLEYAASHMRVYFFGIVFAGISFSCINIMRFVGKIKYSIFFVVFRRIVLTIPLLLIMPRLGLISPNTAVLMTAPIVDALGAAIILFSTIRITRKL